MAKRTDLIEVRETRSIEVRKFEARADGDTLTLEGYASVFDAPYDVYGGPEKGGWSEVVDKAAFKKTLSEKPDLHLLINHEGMPLARTKSGTLKLSTDGTGLKVVADLDRSDPDVQRLEPKMLRGDMDEMSFAFRVMKQQWTGGENDDDERRLLEVSLHKGDVSVVNFGANPATTASLRSISDVFAALKDIEPDAALAELRSGDSENLLTELADAVTKLTELRRNLTAPATRTKTLEEVRRILEETPDAPVMPSLPAA